MISKNVMLKKNCAKFFELRKQNSTIFHMRKILFFEMVVKTFEFAK